MVRLGTHECDVPGDLVAMSAADDLLMGQGRSHVVDPEVEGGDSPRRNERHDDGTTAGSVDRRLVFIANYDGDNADTDNDPFTGTDPGLLWVRVEIEGSVAALQALKTD